MLGTCVQGFAIGQWVTSFTFTGSHAELRVTSAATAFDISGSLDLATAAAMPCGSVKAAVVLEIGRLTSDNLVLVRGATGGVGNAAVQIAAARGASKIGISRSLESYDRFVTLGLVDGAVPSRTPASHQVLALIDRLLAEAAVDHFTVLIDAPYPMSKIAAAHARAEAGGKLGSVVVVPCSRR